MTSTQRTLAVMVCSHCGLATCHEGKRISLTEFDALADAGIFLKLEPGSKHSSSSKECELVDDEHHHDESARWKSASRKIVEAEIGGYELELAALRGEYAHSRIKVVEHAMEIVQGQIDALKLLAGKFD
jgi:hypothetical protein